MKKVFMFSLIAGLVLASSVGLVLAYNQSSESKCKGDFNRDGAVNSGDIYKFVQFWNEHNHQDFWYADMTRDGFVDMRDREAFKDAIMQIRPLDCKPGK